MGCAIGKEGLFFSFLFPLSFFFCLSQEKKIESSEKPQERKRVEKEYAPPSGSQSTQ